MKAEMRIPKTAPVLQPVVPTAFPEYSIDASIQGRLIVHFWDQSGESNRKPKGVCGAEIRWEARETAPETAEDLSNSNFATRTPYTFAFTDREQGQRVYFCLRWENNRGEKGPWGAIVSAVVPRDVV
jgi:hypothetical protein